MTSIPALNTQLRQYFTLIELMVVIFIISILASLLLPALSSARDIAVSLKCLNNLKTLSTAQALYSNDSRGYLSSFYMVEDLHAYVGLEAGDSLYFSSTRYDNYTSVRMSTPFICPASAANPHASPWTGDESYLESPPWFMRTYAGASVGNGCQGRDYHEGGFVALYNGIGCKTVGPTHKCRRNYHRSLSSFKSMEGTLIACLSVSGVTMKPKRPYAARLAFDPQMAAMYEKAGGFMDHGKGNYNVLQAGGAARSIMGPPVGPLFSDYNYQSEF